MSGEVEELARQGAGGVPRCWRWRPAPPRTPRCRPWREALTEAEDEILAANARDVRRAEDAGVEAHLVDRLRLTTERVAAMAEGLRDLAAAARPRR